MTNAWFDPWIPVARQGVTDTVSLRTVLADAHLIDGFADNLYPLARTSLHRLVDSAAAYGLQAVTLDEVDEFGDTGRYPEAALERLEALSDRFELLHPETPFLQQWRYEPPVDTGRGFNPLDQLDPHVPGAESSKMGTRPRTGPMSEADVLIGLTVFWFSSNWSNRSPLPGLANSIIGSPIGEFKVTIGFHWIGENLGLTTAAGIRETWTRPGPAQVPVWLDQDHRPTLRQITAAPESMWRATFTPNRAWILSVDGTPTAWGAGAVDARGHRYLSAFGKPSLSNETDNPVKLSARAKDGAKNIGAESPYKLVFDVKRKIRKTGDTPAREETVRVTYRKFDHSLLSTRAVVTWFESGVSKAMRSWGQDRVAEPGFHDPKWRLGVFSNQCDDKGSTVQRSTWIELNPGLLTAAGEEKESLLVVLKFLRRAREESSVLAGKLFDGAAAAGSVLSAADRVVQSTLADAAAGQPIDSVAVCRTLYNILDRAASDLAVPLMTPDRAAEVAAALGRYRARMLAALPKGTEATTTIEGAAA